MANNRDCNLIEVPFINNRRLINKKVSINRNHDKVKFVNLMDTIFLAFFLSIAIFHRRKIPTQNAGIVSYVSRAYIRRDASFFSDPAPALADPA